MEKKNSGSIIGGTQYIPLPGIIPGVRNKNIWVGFPKSHVEKCGCGSRFYRPLLSLMIEEDGIYHLELTTPNIYFGEDVLGWSLKDNLCGHYNVLSPSSINTWFIAGQEKESKKFTDYMSLTFSEADSVSKTVTIKGVLNYVLSVYGQKQLCDTFGISKEASSIVEKTAQCVRDALVFECKQYGVQHPEFKSEQKTK